MAVVVGLREVPAPARVRIHIDSSYVLYTFTPAVVSAGKVTAGGRQAESR